MVNELTAIDGVPLDYDDNGNIIEDERYTYVYDEENRLQRVTRRSGQPDRSASTNMTPSAAGSTNRPSPTGTRHRNPLLL